MSQPRHGRFSIKLRLPFFALATAKTERKRRASSSENGAAMEAATAFEGHAAPKTDDSSNSKQPTDRLCPSCKNQTASKKLNSSGVGSVVVCKCRKAKNFFRRDPRRHSHAGTSEPNSSLRTSSKSNLDYFEDEADLFEELVPDPRLSNATSDEDAGVCVAASLSPSTSSEGHRDRVVKRRLTAGRSVPSQSLNPRRPASCTFGNLDYCSDENNLATFVKANFLDPKQGNIMVNFNP